MRIYAQSAKIKKASLLVTDPLSGAFGGNENDRTAVYDFVSSFRGWGDTAECAMLVIGHLPKNEEGKKAGYSGNSAWEASVRAMWKLEKKIIHRGGEGKKKETKHYWALEHTKSNYAALQSPVSTLPSKNRAGGHRLPTERKQRKAFEALPTGKGITPRRRTGTMTQISSIFNANGLIAKIAKKEGFDGEPPTLADIQDMAIATPESVNRCSHNANRGSPTGLSPKRE